MFNPFWINTVHLELKSWIFALTPPYITIHSLLPSCPFLSPAFFLPRGMGGGASFGHLVRTKKPPTLYRGGGISRREYFAVGNFVFQMCAKWFCIFF